MNIIVTILIMTNMSLLILWILHRKKYLQEMGLITSVLYTSQLGFNGVVHAIRNKDDEILGEIVKVKNERIEEYCLAIDGDKFYSFNQKKSLIENEYLAYRDNEQIRNKIPRNLLEKYAINAK